MSVDTDLATLRDWIGDPEDYSDEDRGAAERACDACDGVEAELSRLRGLIEGSATDEAILQAAEARCARLQQALEPARVFMEHFVPVEEALINGFDVDAWCALADEALAGPDTPADSQEDA